MRNGPSDCHRFPPVELTRSEDRGQMTEVAARAMRSDARRTRELVLAAAEDVFSEMGLRAQIEEVARRAGVGVGTVCRHFPTKQALIEAVLEAMYESLLDDARHALEQPDPGTAFQTFVFALSEFHARHRALAEHMATEINLPESSQPVRDAMREAIDALVARAQEAGAIRADVGPADIALLFSGVAHPTALPVRGRPPPPRGAGCSAPRAAQALCRADPRRSPPAGGEPASRAPA